MSSAVSVTPAAIRARVKAMVHRSLLITDFTYEGAVRYFRTWMLKLGLTREERRIVAKQVEQIFLDMERRLRVMRQQVQSEVFNPFGGNDGGETKAAGEGQNQQRAGSVHSAPVRAGGIKRSKHGRSR